MNNDKIKNGDAMSGITSSGARRRRTTRIGAWLGAAALCATGASLVPLGGHTQAAPGDPMSEGMLCTDGNVDANGARVFNLIANDGYTSEPDGNAIYDWGYADGDASGRFQLPGPVLCAWQGETVIVNLANQLPVSTSIQFPGQQGVTSAGLPVGPVSSAGELVALVPEAAPQGSVSYSFTAASAGTYLYESGSDPQLQVQMGLFGDPIRRRHSARTDERRCRHDPG
jgi:FtsP/CotA-like multicopper oxidase with cupredoxin domain